MKIEDSQTCPPKSRSDEGGFTDFALSRCPERSRRVKIDPPSLPVHPKGFARRWEELWRVLKS